MGALPFASQTVGLFGVTLTLHSYTLASEQPFRAAPTIPNAWNTASFYLITTDIVVKGFFIFVKLGIQCRVQVIV